MSTTRPYQDLSISTGVVPRRSITRRYASTLHNLIRAFTFAGTMLLTSGAAVAFLSYPTRLPRPHEVAMAAGSTDDNSTGTTADLSGVPIGIALLCLGVFAYLTALGMYCKDRCSHHGEMAMRYRGVCRGDESPAGQVAAVKAHVPAVTALHVYRPQIKYQVVLVTPSSPVCKFDVKVVDVSRTTTPV